MQPPLPQHAAQHIEKRNPSPLPGEAGEERARAVDVADKDGGGKIRLVREGQAQANVAERLPI